jgi:hypothetical protein
MEFEIVIYIYSKPYRMQVKRIYEGDSIEKFEVKGGERSIILRNNRPELKLKRARKKPTWQIDGGKPPSNPQSFALTVLAIEKKIEEIENPPKPFSHWKNS